MIEFVYDPSAGSPTETLLRLLLPLSDEVHHTLAVCHLIYITALQSLSSHLYNCFTMQQLSLNVYQPLLSVARYLCDHSSMAHQYFFNSSKFVPYFKNSLGFEV